MLPKGGTAPGKHFVNSKTSYGFAKSRDFKFTTFLNILKLNFLLADITARKNIFDLVSLSSIAFAPLSKDTPLTFADSSLVLQA